MIIYYVPRPFYTDLFIPYIYGRKANEYYIWISEEELVEFKKMYDL